MKKVKTQNLNDGFLVIYKPKDIKTDFNAKVSPKKMDDLEFFVELAYEEEFKREQDYEFAESIEHALSLKVRTLLYDKVTNEHKAIIDSIMYNILKIDYAKKDKVMYLYLEEEREIA